MKLDRDWVRPILGSRHTCFNIHSYILSHNNGMHHYLEESHQHLVMEDGRIDVKMDVFLALILGNAS